MRSPALLIGAAVAALAAFAFTSEESKAEAAKPKPGGGKPGTGKPRAGQPTPGVVKSPGLPSIPAPPPGQEGKPVGPDVLARMVAALGTGNPDLIRAEADKLDREGYPQQAQELRAAADAIEAAQSETGGPIVPIPVLSPPPNAVPIKTPPPATKPPIKVTKPPVNAIPVPPPTIVTTMPVPAKSPAVIVVDKPPPDAVPVPAPATGAPPNVIPDTATLAGKVALMLYESAPNGPVRDVPLLTAWKQKVGLKDAGHLYGAGTAKSLMLKEIVPPTPWDWPSDSTRRNNLVKDLIGNYKYKASKDAARREEWLAAAADVKARYG